MRALCTNNLYFLDDFYVYVCVCITAAAPITVFSAQLDMLHIYTYIYYTQEFSAALLHAGNV